MSNILAMERSEDCALPGFCYEPECKRTCQNRPVVIKLRSFNVESTWSDAAAAWNGKMVLRQKLIRIFPKEVVDI